MPADLVIVTNATKQKKVDLSVNMDSTREEEDGSFLVRPSWNNLHDKPKLLFPDGHFTLTGLRLYSQSLRETNLSRRSSLYRLLESIAHDPYEAQRSPIIRISTAMRGNAGLTL